MNRKRKHNELYKGVFKNDKKSCLVDLKPREEVKNMILEEKENQCENYPRQRKTLDLNLKVAKNLKFGTYFTKLREEIVDIFTQDDEYISFDGLFSFNKINDLFNFREAPNTEPSNIMTTTENKQSYYQDEIIYEDENQTIIKRKKTVEKLRNRQTMDRRDFDMTNMSAMSDSNILNQIFGMPERKFKYN
jgi:hypothetical protein